MLSVLIFKNIFQRTLTIVSEQDETWGTHARNISVGAWASQHVLTSLTPHKTYVARLMAHNDLGASAPSQTILFTTFEEGKNNINSSAIFQSFLTYKLNEICFFDRICKLKYNINLIF